MERERSRSSERERDRGGRDEGSRSSRSSSGGRSERYQRRDPKLTKERANRKGREFDSFLKEGVKTFTPKEGDNVVRFLPPGWKDPDHYGFTVFVHFNIGPDNGAYLCLRKMRNEPCPCCEEFDRAEKEGDKEYAASIKVSERVLAYIIDRDKESEGAMLWSMSWSMDRDISACTVDKRSGDVLALDDPDNGYDVEFTREGKGLKTKYIGVKVARRESDLGDDSLLDFVRENPIPDLLLYHDYDYISNVFGGKSGSSGSQDRGAKASDRETPRARDRVEQDDYSYGDIMKMDFNDLDDIVSKEKLGIKPDEYADTEDLADYRKDVAKALGVHAPREESSGDSTRSRLRDMRGD